jgi:predicted dehydrogenase
LAVGDRCAEGSQGRLMGRRAKPVKGKAEAKIARKSPKNEAVNVRDLEKRLAEFNVGQMCALFADAIRTGQSRVPTFDTAVDLHRFIDAIEQASDAGREMPVA